MAKQLIHVVADYDYEDLTDEKLDNIKKSFEDIYDEEKGGVLTTNQRLRIVDYYDIDNKNVFLLNLDEDDGYTQVDIDRFNKRLLTTVAETRDIAVFVTPSTVEISYHYNKANDISKKILHVSVGDANWTPTNEQLEQVAALFTETAKDAGREIEVVATCKGVRVESIVDLDSYKVVVDQRNNPETDIDRNNKHEVAASFYSGENKRVENNPININDYEGPDDVSLRYRPLSDQEKSDMGEIKLMTQQLINKIRSLRRDPKEIIPGTGYYNPYTELTQAVYLDKAVENAQLASMFATKYITGPR